jgi:hypothetical protein
MFDLEQSIRDWRRTMSARLPFQRDAVAELESHLRDAVHKHQQCGLTLEDCWTASLKQLGDPDLIALEYGKVTACSVWQWRPAQVVLALYAAMALSVAYASSRAFANRGDALLAIHVWTITVGYLAVFAVGAIAAYATLTRALRGWTTIETDVFLRTARSITTLAVALIATGIILGGIWLRLTSGQFWNFDPREIGGIALLIWNALVVVLLLRSRDERLEMRLGLAGNAVVGACWFGPILLSKPETHGFGGISLASSTSISVFVLLTLLLGASTFLRPGRLRLR